ncbi:MAG TPA: alanine--tRNA ligase [Candidatus Binataceae bacterium]|nr:alanine--tRNA ligase [Candidatus Binataceae bacterium]
MRWTTDAIRSSFLDFFGKRGHTVVPSASLIPKGDPTLLFTNAGMVQFKDYFLGLRTPTSRRVADCQKCLRISGKHNDLEAVGRDGYHHTFFEMLGNWSFGDYYKTEAIAWHWELITRVWAIPAGRLYATIYRTDDEARDAWLASQAAIDWKAGGVDPITHILPFDEKDNFWEMGETGPCGPCSEIHIDRGPEASAFCPHPAAVCGVNVDGCARFIELGNLVFIQYNRDSSGQLTPLPMKHVDTGTGLERVAAVLQSLESGRYLGNYETDAFQRIISVIEENASATRPAPKYGGSPADVSYRAIADHARAATFLIADGVKPGNADRSYVLRRLIRRAVRHGNRLGARPGFLAAVCVRGVIASMKNAYPELTLRESEIQAQVESEELRFSQTLERGLELIAEWREREGGAKRDRFPGELAFQLHDTYGFPIDLTQDILRDDGLTVDLDEFNHLMERQRERARAARKDDTVAPEIMLGAGSSRFVGADRYNADSEVIAANADNGNFTLVTAESPFYPEGGGQVGDRGVIETESGALLEVFDTRKQNGAILHLGRLLRGDAREFAPGRRVSLRVDRARRDAAMRNHSATHILHYALREIAGAEVHQAGSLVEPGRLRFDFSHQGPLAESDLLTIEEEINARIRENADVTTEEMAYDDAIRTGALAFFGDKYGDRVRVVRMGDFSTELCGGTHVRRTGDIGFFRLAAESGVAAGVRRIEALTGQAALDAIRRREKILASLGDRLGARDENALERLEAMLAREKELEKKLRALEQKLISGETGGKPAEDILDVNGVRLITRKLDGVEPRAMRDIADRLRDQHKSAVVALGSDLGENKAALLVAVTADLVGRVKAGDIVKLVAPVIDGSGGGRPDFAQAGGRNPAKIGAALDAIVEQLQRITRSS